MSGWENPAPAGGGGGVTWRGPWYVSEGALQTITVSGADGGTFTLTDEGDTTPPIAWDATPAAVAAALNAANPGKWTASGDLVTGLTLAAESGAAPVFQLTADPSGLTSGGLPGGDVLFSAPGQKVEIELLTQAVGDILEDILIEVISPFTFLAASLGVETETGELLSAATFYPDLNGLLDGRTNYSGNEANSGAELAPTSYGIELAGGNPYPIIPAVCLDPSPLAAYLSSAADADRNGVAKVYLKTVTPVAP